MADNAAMVQKLLLPFPLLSDPNGALIQRFGLWNAEEHVAVPSIIVVDQAGTIIYRYTGHDFADRPGDAEVLTALAQMERGGAYEDEAPQIQVAPEEAQQSVGPDRRAMSLEELVPYYQGAFSTSVVLKGRLAARGEREAASEISSYQDMVRDYRDALKETVTMK